MTVKELIKKLKMCPNDMRVVVNGYEGGYDNINNIEKIQISRDKKHADWDGEFVKGKEEVGLLLSRDSY